jgi:hypothetical protein
VQVPGPGGLLWGLELLAFGALCLPLGELLRSLAAPYVGFFRSISLVERVLLDLFLAGGVFYVVGWLPIESGALSFALLLAGGALLMVLRALRRSTPSGEPPVRRQLASPGVLLLLLLLLLSLLLFALEVGAAEAAPSGNTFDSGILATFVGLANLHHQLPTSFLPVAAQGIAYPQGTTAWILPVQWLFGLPPARAPLLLTPLFFALVPAGGYVWGERWWGNRRAAVALALALTLLASWTRLLVSGSNDFVLAFPLVLLLWAWTPWWCSVDPPGLADALAFGAIAGYAAALNPAGTELWFLSIPLLLLFTRGVRWTEWSRWLTRWAAAMGVALLLLLPSLSVLLAGRSNPGLPPGAAASPAGGAIGLSFGQIVGYLDPMLFGPSNLWLSPFPILRAELAALLIAGAFLLYVLPHVHSSRGNSLLARFAPSLLASTALVLFLDAGASPLSRFTGSLTSAPESSMLLFTVYAAIAAVPLITLVDWAAGSGSPSAHAVTPSPAPSAQELPHPTRPRRRPASTTHTAVLASVAVGLLLLPGIVVTASDAPDYLRGVYQSFGNTTESDFALLAWADSNLPHGARVLVAPGSAGQFLPGYRPDIALLYPEIPASRNLSYSLVVRELDAGKLDAAGLSALSALAVQYVLVTGESNELWPAFSPRPLLASPVAFPVYFDSGDAYLFGVNLGGSLPER